MQVALVQVLQIRDHGRPRVEREVDQQDRDPGPEHDRECAAG